MNDISTTIESSTIPDENSVFIAVSVLFVLTVIIIPAHLLAIYILYRFENFRRNASFQLLARVIILEFVQMTGLIYSGLFFWFPSLYNWEIVRKFYGVVLCCFFPALFALKCELTVFRILIALRLARPEKLSLSIKVVECIGWLLVLLLCIGAWVDDAMDFDMYQFYWTYRPESIVAKIIAQMELYICIPLILITYVLYMLMLSIIYSMKKKTQQRFRKSKEEWTLFWQNTITTVYYIVIILIFHVPDLFDKAVQASMWYFVGNCIAWITAFYWTSLLLLFCNRSIRKKIRFTRSDRTESTRIVTVAKKSSS